MRVNERTFTSAARRAQIVAAAIDVIAELGLAAATFARIAERAELSSTRMISYHFAGRDDLMEAVVARVFEVGGEYVGPFVLEEPTPAGQLRGFIVGNARFYAEFREHVLAVREVWSNLRRPDGTRRFGFELHEPEFEMMAGIFRAGQASGEFRTFDPRIMAITLRQALDGLSLRVHTDPEADVDAWTRELVATFDAATRRLP